MNRVAVAVAALALAAAAGCGGATDSADGEGPAAATTTPAGGSAPAELTPGVYTPPEPTTPTVTEAVAADDREPQTTYQGPTAEQCAAGWAAISERFGAGPHDLDALSDLDRAAEEHDRRCPDETGLWDNIDAALSDAIAAVPPTTGPAAEPEPATPSSAPEPATPAITIPATPDPPEGTLVTEDRAAEAPEGQPSNPQHPGAVTLGNPVKLSTFTSLLCPAAEALTAGGWESCGDDLDNPLDYLHPDSFVWRSCYHPPVRLEPGDSYVWEKTVEWPEPRPIDGEQVAGYRLRVEGEIVGFSAPIISDDKRWAWTTPTISQTTTTWAMDQAGAFRLVETLQHDDRPADDRWAQVGGPDNRGVENGVIAWGLIAVPPPLQYQQSC